MYFGGMKRVLRYIRLLGVTTCIETSDGYLSDEVKKNEMTLELVTEPGDKSRRDMETETSCSSGETAAPREPWAHWGS